jgi:type IV pilus assembly protein PilV
MVILAVGLLGLAGLQATTMSNNNDAYLRSQATQLAYDIADRMRANLPAANAGTYISALPDGAATANCKKPAGCSITQMAQTDIFEWQQRIGDILPAGTGTMALAGNIFTITISWDDDRDNNNANNASFETSFQL